MAANGSQRLLPATTRGPREYYGIRAETDRDGHVLEQKLAARR